MSTKDVAVEAVLPNEINTFEYTRNHHFVRFRRKGGSELKLVPSGQMLYECDCCEFFCYADSNHGQGLKCPKCYDPLKDTGKLHGKWMKPQTVMVPEKETDFEWPEGYPAEEKE
ncbi:MAG: hypothetical protein ACWGQW_05200 [bacterium]